MPCLLIFLNLCVDIMKVVGKNPSHSFPEHSSSLPVFRVDGLLGIWPFLRILPTYSLSEFLHLYFF